MTGHVPGLTDPSVATGWVDEGVKDMGEWLWGEAFLSVVGGTLTTDGTEQTLYVDSEPLGVFRPVVLVLDLDAMQGGDTIVVKVYHRMSDAGNLKLLAYHSWTGADGGLSNGEVLDSVNLIPNRHGWHLTLQRTGGSDRDYPWELYMEI